MWRTKRKEEFSASLSSDTGRPLVTLLFLFFHFQLLALYVKKCISSAEQGMARLILSSNLLEFGLGW